MPSPDQIQAYAALLGCTPREAKLRLDRLEFDLRERVARAAVEQARSGADSLHDPIEDEAAMAGVLLLAEREAETMTQESADISGYLLWSEKAKILRSRYGVTWFNPSEMNPHTFYS